MGTKQTITDASQEFVQQQKNNTALVLALLFHTCGAVGIMFTEYKNWFIAATPVTLLLMAVLLVYTQAEKNISFFLFVCLCFLTGMAAEIIGVNTGLLFGKYEYSETLGFKLYGVPLIIGINWFISVFCSGNLIYLLNEWLYKKLAATMQPSFAVKLFTFVFDAALLTTLFDYILEPSAAQLGFWKWLPNGAVPVYNFICWFVISAILLTVFRLLKFNKHNHFAVHLLIIQILFFLSLQTFL